MGSTLPVRGGVRAQLSKDFDPVPEIVPYGKRYRNVEDIFDFIISYGRYLESVGFEFFSYSSFLICPDSLAIFDTVHKI